MTDTAPSTVPLDILGIGVGPFNLALAALAHPLTALRTAFFEQQDEFRWHAGMMIDGVTVQVPFLADLVTLADPTSRWSYLNYLKAHDRLFPFYLAERFHIPRAEYDDYCRWVSQALPSCHFGKRVRAVRWDADASAFHVEVTSTGPTREVTHHLARTIVLGIGTEPVVPPCFRELVANPARLVLHSADYLPHRERLVSAPDVTVVGAGQSGAEIFLDLLRRRPRQAERLRWLARTPAFAPMEYSRLGLEHFTPDYTRYFHGLQPDTRAALAAEQWQLYKGISARTMTDIGNELYDRSVGGSWPKVVLTPGVTVAAVRCASNRIELELHHQQQREQATIRTDAVVLATGYAERRALDVLPVLTDQPALDAEGRLRVGLDYRLHTDDTITGSIFVQNAERHTHGVGAPDLGLAAWRAATILNNAVGRTVYTLPQRSAFTTFGLS